MPITPDASEMTTTPTQHATHPADYGADGVKAR